MGIQLLVKAPQSPEKVYKALRDDSKDVIRILRLLEVDWPEAIDVVKSLCAHLSDGLCDSGGKPVLFDAVQCGLGKYSSNLRKGDDYRYTVFLKTVFDSLGASLNGHIAVHNNSNSSWRPDDETGFKDWWGDADDIEVSIVKGTCSKESVIEAMMFNVLEDYQIEMIETLHGEAV